MSIYLYIYLSIHLSIYLPIYRPSYLSIYLSIHSIHPILFYPSIHLSTIINQLQSSVRKRGGLSAAVLHVDDEVDPLYVSNAAFVKVS